MILSCFLQIIVINLATGGSRGNRGLQGLEGDPHPGVHKVLLLQHAQPRGLPGKPRQAHHRAAGAIRLQVSPAWESHFRVTANLTNDY